MNPAKMLEQAKNEPQKQSLEAYLETIWELRGKGNTYRQIADFLKDRGVKTDHTAVYRLIEEEKPESYFKDCVLIDDIPYEAREGRPLRVFSAGLFISIKERLKIVPLERAESTAPIWCEAQFVLNAPPNHSWLKKLRQCLDMNWNPKAPWHMRGRFDTELKFEGDLLALVCPIYNLETEMKKLAAGISMASNYFSQNKALYARLHQLVAERDEKIIPNIAIEPGESVGEAVDEIVEWRRGYAKKLTEQFHSISLL